MKIHPFAVLWRMFLSLFLLTLLLVLLLTLTLLRYPVNMVAREMLAMMRQLASCLPRLRLPGGGLALAPA